MYTSLTKVQAVAAIREAGSQAARQPGSQAARQPGSQAARQPGSQAASPLAGCLAVLLAGWSSWADLMTEVCPFYVELLLVYYDYALLLLFKVVAEVCPIRSNQSCCLGARRHAQYLAVSLLAPRTYSDSSIEARTYDS